MRTVFIVGSLLFSLIFSTASPAADSKSKDGRTSIKPKPGDIIEPQQPDDACSEVVDLDTCTIFCEPEPCTVQPGQTCNGQLSKKACEEAQIVPKRNL